MGVIIVGASEVKVVALEMKIHVRLYLGYSLVV